MFSIANVGFLSFISFISFIIVVKSNANIQYKSAFSKIYAQEKTLNNVKQKNKLAIDNEFYQIKFVPLQPLLRDNGMKFKLNN